MLDFKSLKLAEIYTDKNVSDILTKVVTKEKYIFCRDEVGMEALSCDRRFFLIVSWSREGEVCWVSLPLMIVEKSDNMTATAADGTKEEFGAKQVLASPRQQMLTQKSGNVKKLQLTRAKRQCQF